MKGLVLMVAAGMAAIVGVVVAVVPFQVLDQGQWVSCGPAIVGDGARFADLACAGVVQPLQTLAVMLLVLSLILIGYGTLALRSGQRVPAVQHSLQRSL